MVLTSPWEQGPQRTLADTLKGWEGESLNRNPSKHTHLQRGTWTVGREDTRRNKQQAPNYLHIKGRELFHPTHRGREKGRGRTHACMYVFLLMYISVYFKHDTHIQQKKQTTKWT